MARPNTTQTTKTNKLQQENDQLIKTCMSLQESLQVLEKHVAEANRERLNAEIDSLELGQIFSAVSDAIWAINEAGIVIRANEAMLELLGKTEDEVIGHDCSELLDYGLCHTRCCPLAIIKGAPPCEHDVQLPSGGDSPQSYILSVAPLKTIVGTTAIISQFKNITERKIAEQQLEELNKTLTEMARVDGLTQISNRRHFDESLQQEWLRLSRERQPISLLLADIDYFKKFNDHYGHQAGDDCLIKIGAALKDSVKRPADLPARYGGEEFVILLPGIDLEGAQHVGQRVMDTIAALAIEHQASEISASVTLSIGAACLFPADGQDPTELIALADAGLYRAKEQGRNRLVCS